MQVLLKVYELLSNIGAFQNQRGETILEHNTFKANQIIYIYKGIKKNKKSFVLDICRILRKIGIIN